ncbi:MAG TPA: hypothetical protein VD947_01360 [Patescibacteria group bacterium]|nr:hypothetical protein [Patescibacteria group bacterium]
MQDDNTIQPTDGVTDDQSTVQPAVIEPTLNLGTNPADVSTTDTPTDSLAAVTDNVTADPATAPSDKVPSEDTSKGDTSSEDIKIEDTPTVQVPSAGSDDLESIRSSALDELTPIISELDQEPEEKYRTLMMLIQASDNQSLIKEAYEAAHKIEDTKAKAEALLNIVNEINYFTGKAGKPEN